LALTICLGPERRRLGRENQHRKVSAIPEETKSVGVTFFAPTAVAFSNIE
jgi:hypothetical protein